jgi:acyl-coenzyme A synthetase/AMP-(fatty) acid ligase
MKERSMQLFPMQDYDVHSESFHLNVPEFFNFGHDVIDMQAIQRDKLALIWCDSQGNERQFNFSDISRHTSQWAHLLVSQGLAKGDRVLILLPRIPEWQIAMVACLKIGAIPIPCVEMLSPKDIQYRLVDSGAKAAITTTANVTKFSTVSDLEIKVVVGASQESWISSSLALEMSEKFQCAAMRAEDPALLYYTSGSSGNPKGVLHASRGIYSWRLSAAWWQTLQESDIKWCTSDTGWAKAGTGILFGPWSRGSCVLFYDGKFDAAERLKLLARFKVTVFCAPATEFRHLVNLSVDEIDLSALRLNVSAGESVNPEIVKRWKEMTGAQLLDGYGQTETLMTVLNYPCMPVKPGSMGKPIPGTRFKILSESNAILNVREVGHLAMELPNPQFMLGYWNNPQRTAENIHRVNGIDYWITGDLAYLDEEGYVFYAGRNDDIINSADYRIGPTEVENALVEHPAVLESAVVASPDLARGEVVKAFVVLRDASQASETLIQTLQNHVNALTAAYKYPRKIEFVESLPKNPSGKVMRKVLRDQEFGGVN